MARFVPNIVNSKIHALDERLGISDFFDAAKYAVTDHPAATAAALSFVIPTATAWATTTPWLAIPLTLGSAVFAAGVGFGVLIADGEKRVLAGMAGGS